MSEDILTSKISPMEWYLGQAKLPQFVYDSAQASVVKELDVLWHQLVDFKSKRNQFLGRSLLSPDVPKGLYLWGGIGYGKTFLMDAFYSCLPYRRKRRIHFHSFMTEVHRELKLLSATDDPLLALSDNIAKSTRLLCLDEFHVDDIADAMILGRLIAALFQRGVILITTSNFPPVGLYPNGLQRNNFMPTIELLKREMRVLHLESKHDYRQRTLIRESLFLVDNNSGEKPLKDIYMAKLFEQLAGESRHEEGHIEILGRRLSVRQATRRTVWFDFKELCGGAHSQSDYLEIARRFHTVFVSDIPQLTPEHTDQARRFTWLIDVFYDNKVKMVASAAVSLDKLFIASSPSIEFGRTSSRLIEMQSPHYLNQSHLSQRVSLLSG